MIMVVLYVFLIYIYIFVFWMHKSLLILVLFICDNGSTKHTQGASPTSSCRRRSELLSQQRKMVPSYPKNRRIGSEGWKLYKLLVKWCLLNLCLPVTFWQHFLMMVYLSHLRILKVINLVQAHFLIGQTVCSIGKLFESLVILYPHFVLMVQKSQKSIHFELLLSQWFG